MRWMNFAELDAAAAHFDACVARTARVDHYCTSSDWAFPARVAFAPEAEPFIAGDAEAYVALMRVPVREGAWAAVPLEAGWGLAAPFAGADHAHLAELLFAMTHLRGADINALFLSGLEREGPLWRALVRRFGRYHRLGVGQICERRVATLRGGYEGWLSRRSAGFRANLRRAQRQAARDGFEFERHTSGDPDALFARIVAVETRSWKGQAGEGIDHGAPHAFYQDITRRLAAKGTLRVIFARRDGRDVAFVFGGLFGRTYRGLQVSFDDALRAYAPGNLAQAEMIAMLAAEGLDFYDLGTDMPYKHRWAEPGLETTTLAILPGD